MNNKIYNKKGLTFKGAFVVVIFAHVVGICSLYGYSKYKSHQLKLAREDWKNKIEQRGNIQNDWKTDDMSSKVVARSHLKIPTEVKPTVTPSVLLEKAQEITGAFLAKANTEINSTLKDINKKEKTQVPSQLVSAFSTIKKKPEAHKTEKIVNKTTVAPLVSSATKQSAPIIVQTVPPPKKIIPTVYNYQPAPVAVRTVPSPKKAIATVPDYQPVSKPITKRTRSYQTQNNSHLKTHEEFDYETQETVQTFYSY